MKSVRTWSNLHKIRISILGYITNNNVFIIKKTNNTYTKVYQSYFEEMTDNDIFMQEQYELIDGKMPTEAEEVLLIVDKYNSISETVLYSLGIDTTKEIYTTEDLIGKKFMAVKLKKVIANEKEVKEKKNKLITVTKASWVFIIVIIIALLISLGAVLFG